MIVSCPNCSTKFNLPDDRVQPGAKLRCSVCKHIFDAPEPEQEAAGPDKKNKLDLSLDFEGAADASAPGRAPKKKWGKKALVLALVLAAIGGAGFAAWRYTPHFTSFFQSAPAQQAPVEDLISRIALRDVRQYTVNNDKTGPVSVIEGKAVNGFPAARELIRIEASLYDKDGKVLVSKQQTAGPSLSQFQLQGLGEQELEQALSNKISILSANTNVPQGGEVPFMIVFYKPPENAAEFGVKIVEARKPPQM